MSTIFSIIVYFEWELVLSSSTQSTRNSVFHVKIATDDYAKDGGPGAVGLLYSFYQDPLSASARKRRS